MEIKNLYNEEWKDIVFDENISDKEKFKISNYGRVLNCKGAEPYFPKDTFVRGYQILHVKQKKNGKSTGRYIHKLVAEHFLEKESEDQTFVIHLNYDKLNNQVWNLKWATKKEKEKHQFSNPKPKKPMPRERMYSKLTETQVQLIKRKINNPNRKTRIKMIAKQFGVSEMQIYRIKTGENWGHVPG